MYSGIPRSSACIIFGFVLYIGFVVVAGEVSSDGSVPWHTYSCGEITSHYDKPYRTSPKLGPKNWTRTFCFDEDIVVKKYNALPRRKNAETEDKGSKVALLYLTMTLRIKKQVYDLPGQVPGELLPVCGDSLRIIFSSSKALFSPTRMAETACGEHTISFVLPRESESYALELRLLHVDGEGKRDPAMPLWPPEEDLNHHQGDGPEVYNMDARVKGLLHAPKGYTRLPIVATPGSSTLVNESKVTGADMGMGGAAAHPFAEAGPGAYHLCRRMCIEKDESEWTDECRLLDAKLGYSLALPACSNGNHPGRWFKSESLYALFKDPWVWQPYSCVYYFYSSEDLNTCLEKRQQRPGIEAKEDGRDHDWPQVKFMGESTLNAIYNEWDEKLNTKYFYWDPVTDAGDDPGQDKDKYHTGYSINKTANKIANKELHGLERMLEHGLEGFFRMSRENNGLTGSDAIILLEGANDVQKDTMARYVANMRKVVRRLQEAEQEDTYFRKDSTIVWVTPPTRQYKPPGGYAGQGVCDHRGDCKASGAHDWKLVERHRGQRSASGVQWRGYPNPQGLLFDTADRRRLASKIAVRMLKAAFPRLKTVDYRSLTEPLPPDYSFDGEHYHCPTLYIHERIGAPWQCIGMVNEVVSNILANVLCNSVSYVFKNEYPYFLSEDWGKRMKAHGELVAEQLEHPEVWSPPAQDTDSAAMGEADLTSDSLVDPQADAWIDKPDAQLEPEGDATTN